MWARLKIADAGWAWTVVPARKPLGSSTRFFRKDPAAAGYPGEAGYIDAIVNRALDGRTSDIVALR